MTAYTPVEPSEDVWRVLDAILRRALARRGLTDVLARLDTPGAVVRVELDDEDATRVFVDGTLATIVPRPDLEHAVGLARIARGHSN